MRQQVNTERCIINN